MVTSLYEKLNIKEFDQMVADTLQYIVDGKVGITNTNIGSVIRTIVEAIIDNDDMANYYIAYVYSALGIDEAEGDDVDRLLAILNMPRYSATQALGVVTMSTGGEPALNDIPIPYGHIISTRQNSDGSIIEFTVNDSNAVLPAGGTDININVIAVNAGHIYIPVGALCILSSSISGIQSVSNNNNIDSGTDKETDDAYKARAKDLSKSFGKCTDSAIEEAVKEISGVLNCTVIDMMNGVGTTGVIVATSIVPPPDDLVTQINNVVKATKASGISASVVYPTVKLVDISITISGIEFDPAVVVSTITSYINSLDIGQSLIIRQMERKILNAIDSNYEDNDNADIQTTPTSNQIPASTEMIRTGTLIINDVQY
jgi:uncharacterized phage protein gp47/JayE